MSGIRGRHVSVDRRHFLSIPLSLLAWDASRGSALAQVVEREQIATVERGAGLTSPLTLGIARVVLRRGALARAAIPQGARMLAVESGVLAVAVTTPAEEALSVGQLAVQQPDPNLSDELFVPAGTTMTFGTRGVATVRNPGGRSAVALDVVVYHEAPRPMARAFTTEEGVSFQLLASASAEAAPAGRVAVTLERVRLGHQAALPEEISAGLTLARVEAGTVEVRADGGEVFAARAAASTPYSMPGSLDPIPAGATRELTAGGVMFVTVGGRSAVINRMPRPAELMTLAVREAD